jgi:hypothetical protein
MIERATSSPLGPVVANLQSDYDFCAYRLRVLEEAPAANRASITAVVARMERLLTELADLQTTRRSFPA